MKDSYNLKLILNLKKSLRTRSAKVKGREPQKISQVLSIFRVRRNNCKFPSIISFRHITIKPTATKLGQDNFQFAPQPTCTLSSLSINQGPLCYKIGRSRPIVVVLFRLLTSFSFLTILYSSYLLTHMCKQRVLQ
jgi:hypothetical protein